MPWLESGFKPRFSGTENAKEAKRQIVIAMLRKAAPHEEIPNLLSEKYPHQIAFANHQSLYTHWGFSSDQKVTSEDSFSESRDPNGHDWGNSLVRPTRAGRGRNRSQPIGSTVGNRYQNRYLQSDGQSVLGTILAESLAESCPE